MARTHSTFRNSAFLPLLTRVAFVLAVALVVARCTMLETLRDPFAVAPGSQTFPSGPGPAASLVLDLLCAIPALLILLRRLIDPTYVLRYSASQLLLIPLAIWMAVSYRWADDRFAALITSINFISAWVLLWTATQLVRSWGRLRIVSAIAYGLLLVLLAEGFYYKLVELPDLQSTFHQNREKIFHDRGWSDSDFAAVQFEKNINSGEMIGFDVSPNSFAAVIVLLMLITCGTIMHRLSDRDPIEWPIALALPLPLAAWLLYDTQSKAAFFTPILGAFFLAAIYYLRPWLGRNARRAYWIGLGAVAATFAGIIVMGLHRHGLPGASMNFRWRYWVASCSMFLHHPLHGVGWDNFGLQYLRYRLPAASEEIKDPHNFIVRFFVELGAVGGLLMLAWLGRLWWEMSRPTAPPALPEPKEQSPAAAARFGEMSPTLRFMLLLASISVLAMLLNILFAIDSSQNASYVFLEVMKRGMWLAALCIGSMLVVLRSIEKPKIDQRPIPWIIDGILVSLGVFLIHNLIEFSLFEVGNACLFGLLAGSILGIRYPSQAGKRRRNFIALCSAIIAGAGWLAVLIFLAIPTARAEAEARAGDASLRAGHFEKAAEQYETAYDRMPLDADYMSRAARALYLQVRQAINANQQAGLPQGWELRTRSLFDVAISKNPSDVNTFLGRGNFAALMQDHAGLIDSYNRAIALNPYEISIRLQYAYLLGQLHEEVLAKAQLRDALKLNAELEQHDTRRLPQKEIDQINQQLLAM